MAASYSFCGFRTPTDDSDSEETRERQRFNEMVARERANYDMEHGRGLSDIISQTGNIKSNPPTPPAIV